MRYLDRETGEFVDYDWKTPFNHDTNAESDRVAITCNDESLTQQSQEEEANINTIVRNFGVTGQLPTIELPPTLDEFHETFDFQSSMNLMAEAKHSFMQLSPEVRAAFNNDPHNFVNQVDGMLADTDQDRRERNLTVMRAMGLAVTKGPKADTTTLGEVLAAIKAQNNAPKGSTEPKSDT